MVAYIGGGDAARPDRMSNSPGPYRSKRELSLSWPLG